jgi:hypothetical protein
VPQSHRLDGIVVFPVALALEKDLLDVMRVEEGLKLHGGIGSASTLSVTTSTKASPS